MSGATGGTSSPFHFNSVEMREAEQAFRQAYPAFESTSSLDALRAREYARLDDLGQIYLDYMLFMQESVCMLIFSFQSTNID